MAVPVPPETNALAENPVCSPVYEHAHSRFQRIKCFQRGGKHGNQSFAQNDILIILINGKRIQFHKNQWKQLHIFYFSLSTTKHFLSVGEEAGPREGTENCVWNEILLLSLSLLFTLQLCGPHSQTMGCDQAQGDLLHRCWGVAAVDCKFHSREGSVRSSSVATLPGQD